MDVRKQQRNSTNALLNDDMKSARSHWSSDTVKLEKKSHGRCFWRLAHPWASLSSLRGAFVELHCCFLTPIRICRSYHIISYRIISYILYHIISYHIISFLSLESFWKAIGYCSWGGVFPGSHSQEDRLKNYLVAFKFKHDFKLRWPWHIVIRAFNDKWQRFFANV